jgi:hypothetical protein
MKNESCDPPRDVDWAEASAIEVVLSAQEGIPGAKAELQRREKEVDTLSAKALSIPEIQIEWIED